MSKNLKEFYENDIVCRFDKSKKIVFGVVADSYQLESSSDVSDELEKGQVRIQWNDRSNEQVCKQNKLTLVSRNIHLGDVVRRPENGLDSQRGYCKSVKKTFTVQIVGTEKIIENVSSNRLQNLCTYDVDDVLCLRSKYGRVEGVDQEITMTSKCGSVVQIMTSINGDLEDYWLVKKNKPSFDGYYEGQELVCIPSALEQPLWIKKTKIMKKNIDRSQRFTVQAVKDCVVEVIWFNGSDGESMISTVKDDEMKELRVLQHTMDYIDTRKLLKINISDNIIKKKDWIKKQSALYRRQILKGKTNSANKSSDVSLKIPNSPQSKNCTKSDDSDIEEEEWSTDDEDDESEAVNESSLKPAQKEKYSKRHFPPKADEMQPGKSLAVEVISMDAKATIVWQDGKEEINIPSTQLCYSYSIDDHEFFPGDWVTHNDKVVFSKNKYGLVQYANYLERIATVKWFQYDEIEKIQTELPLSEMSVYDLKKHPKFVFKPGSVVRAKPVQENKMGKVINSCPEGYIIVKWIDGTEENCSPHAIDVIPETAEYEIADDEDTDDKVQLSWETESVGSFTAGDSFDETMLQNMAARLDFIRNRIIYFREAFKNHVMPDKLLYIRDFLIVYDYSSYLDKLLGTSFFSLKSKHFQILLAQAKEISKVSGVELKGRLFMNDTLFPSGVKLKVAEKENLQRVLTIENKVITHIENSKLLTGTTPELDESQISHNDVCIEILSMLKLRMDLAYAEIISSIGGKQALTTLTQALEARAEPTASTPIPNMPDTPENSFSCLSSPILEAEEQSYQKEAYCVLDEAPVTHHYFGKKFEPADKQRFLKAIQKQFSLLNESLPPGVWVRSFNNRMDLLSVMIKGPVNTPYEDGLFLFDIQLSQDYPRSPPLVHYISYSSERLNPNLYVEGKVCVSLLGTWMGKGTEVWGPNSTLLQLFVSIQGLILVAEPYFNEAGYDKQTDTPQGYENSRTYNELVILKLVQSMTEMLLSPPEVFRQIVFGHFAHNGAKLIERLRNYCLDKDPLKPEFSLLPVSKGLKLSLRSALDSFEETCNSILRNKIN